MNTFETNMRDGPNMASGDAPKNKVYYIADVEGTIASYNPNYILRKLPGEDPYKMALPSAAGTLALTSDIGAVSGEIYEEIDEIKDNYNKLRTDTDEISGKVDALGDIVSGTDVAHLGKTETFTGEKTFSNPILVGDSNAGLSVTYAGFVRNVDGVEHTYDLPLKSGQLALNSDLSAYRAASAQDSIDAAQDAAIAAKYTKPSGGIPASDLASGVIPTAPVLSVNGKTGAVVLAASDVGAATEADATLTERSGFTDWVIEKTPSTIDFFGPAFSDPGGGYDAWACTINGIGPITSDINATDPNALRLEFHWDDFGSVVCTRTAKTGYQLGSQSDKPLAPAGDYALKSEIPNVPVKAVKRNGAALTPDAQGAVDVEVPTSFDRIVSPNGLTSVTARNDGSVVVSPAVITISGGFSGTVIGGSEPFVLPDLARFRPWTTYYGETWLVLEGASAGEFGTYSGFAIDVLDEGQAMLMYTVPGMDSGTQSDAYVIAYISGLDSGSPSIVPFQGDWEDPFEFDATVSMSSGVARLVAYADDIPRLSPPASGAQGKAADAKAAYDALDLKLDKADVVHPDTTAAIGKAAGAKATADLLANKVGTNGDQTINNGSLTVGTSVKSPVLQAGTSSTNCLKISKNKMTYVDLYGSEKVINIPVDSASATLATTDDIPTVDDALSDNSTNPVQNKVLKSAFDNKMSASATGSDIPVKSGVQTTVACAVESLESSVGSLNSSVGGIERKIPSAATASNQLADKAFVTDSITQGTAVFRGSFATKAALDAVRWQTADPSGANFVSNNDYAVVLDDETHSDECWRYLYVVSSGSGSWTAQYRINESPLTQAQLDALNSGVTAAVVAKAESAVQPSSLSEAISGIPVGSYANMDALADRLNALIRALRTISGPDDRTMWFHSLQDGSTVSMQKVGDAPTVSLEYSVDDGVNWAPFVVGTTVVTINKGKWARIRAAEGVTNTQFASSTSNYNSLLLSGSISVGGNSMSLFYHDDSVAASATSFPDATKSYIFYRLFYNSVALKDASLLILPATTLASDCYYSMFYGCTGLAAAPELPATTLTEGCYSSMFSECTGLTAAPELPATTLASYCYGGMFHGCTGLTAAPELPATTLASYCYSGMFSECTGLTSAPELPATTLTDECYSSMFYGCTGLAAAPELPATTLASYCYYRMFYNCTNLSYVRADFLSFGSGTGNWLYGVSATGEFHCNPSLVISERGTSTVPSGWTVVTDR